MFFLFGSLAKAGGDPNWMLRNMFFFRLVGEKTPKRWSFGADFGSKKAHAVNIIGNEVGRLSCSRESFLELRLLYWFLSNYLSPPLIVDISFLIDFVVSIRLSCFFFCPESVADCSTNDFGR